MVSPEEKRAVRVRRSLDVWRDVEGEILHSFTIITTVPNALLRRIHNRMPVIFDALQARQWLDPRLSTRDSDIAAVLAPFPSELMESHDVSPLVNKPEFDSPIASISDGQLRLISALLRRQPSSYTLQQILCGVIRTPRLPPLAAPAIVNRLV